MPLPTWNGQPIATAAELTTVLPEAFKTLQAAMGGPSVKQLTEEELLHIAEAAGHLESMVEWAHAAVVPAARVAGASWAKLGAAMGVSRSTAQYRYEKAAKEWEERAY